MAFKRFNHPDVLQTFEPLQIPVTIQYRAKHGPPSLPANDVKSYGQNELIINVLQLYGVKKAILHEIRFMFVAHKSLGNERNSVYLRMRIIKRFEQHRENARRKL
jgi:hypothetical protein